MGVVVGLIADTHGLVRPSVFDALRGVSLLLHAGDVGEGVLEELGAIATVRAVRGNTDPFASGLPDALDLDLEKVTIHVSHGHELGSPNPDKLLLTYPADVIVYGHTHKPLVVSRDGRWVIDPGAAGPQRFKLTPSVAQLTLDSGGVSVEIIELS